MPHSDTDHVLSELEDVIQDLETEKQKANQRRKSATITDEYGGQAELGDPGEFEGSVELRVPHGTFRNDRPVTRRSDGDPPPLSSSGISVTTPSGSDPGRLDPDTTYNVTVDVRNAGTYSTRNAPIELFVAHYDPTGTTDTSAGTLQLARDTAQTITGFTTLPPGAKIIGIGFEPGAATLDSSTIKIAGSWTVDDDRTFEVSGDLSDAPSGDYTFRLYDGQGAPPQKAIDRTIVGANAISDSRLDGYESVILDGLEVIGSVDGTFTSGIPFNSKKNLQLEERLGTATFHEHQSLEIHPQSRNTVTFSYQTPTTRGNRVLTAFYARTYSRAPEDWPSDMERLDHTQSRFVGRTERSWNR